MTGTTERQRIGQFISNYIRKNYKGTDESHHIAQILWNMSDTEFYKILKEKEKSEYKPVEICPKHHRVLDDRGHCRDCNGLPQTKGDKGQDD